MVASTRLNISTVGIMEMSILDFTDKCNNMLFSLGPTKEDEEVVEEMETSTSLEEDSIPVISR